MIDKNICHRPQLKSLQLQPVGSRQAANIDPTPGKKMLSISTVSAKSQLSKGIGSCEQSQLPELCCGAVEFVAFAT